MEAAETGIFFLSNQSGITSSLSAYRDSYLRREHIYVLGNKEQQYDNAIEEKTRYWIDLGRGGKSIVFEALSHE